MNRKGAYNLGRPDLCPGLGRRVYFCKLVGFANVCATESATLARGAFKAAATGASDDDRLVLLQHIHNSDEEEQLGPETFTV